MHKKLITLLAVLGASAYAFAASTATLHLSNISPPTGAGSITVSFDTYMGSVFQGNYTETVSYGPYSTPGSVASALAARFSADPISALPSLCTQGVCAKANGADIVFQLDSADSFGPITVTPTTDFQGGTSGIPLTPLTFVQSMTLVCSPNPLVNNHSAQCVAAISGGNLIATGSIAFTLDGHSWQSATLDASGQASISGLDTASVGTHTVKAIYGGDSNFDSLDQTTLVLVSVSSIVPTNVYGYSITWPDGSSGYDANGNIAYYSDALSGNWQLGYDNLNRLTSADQTTLTNQTVHLCWTYDSFGNRTGQENSSSSCAGSAFSPTTRTSVDASNHVISTIRQTAFGNVYDAAGNVLDDGVNQYMYDGNGKVCAVYNYAATEDHNPAGTYTQYIYDAEGNRVAERTASSLNCDDPIGNGISVSYVLGPSGAAMTELDDSGHWVYTNAYVGGSLLATFADDDEGVHFHLADWLGTRRMQTNYAGIPEMTFQNMPFGDLKSFSGYGADVNNDHFTGQQYDFESGLDYYHARYYSNAEGRFTTPDPYSGSFDFDNPQSFNRYAYVANNPLSFTDPTGMVSGPCNAAGLADASPGEPCLVRIATQLCQNMWCKIGVAVVAAAVGVATFLGLHKVPLTVISQLPSAASDSITCNTQLPNGKSVGQYVQDARAQMDAVTGTGSPPLDAYNMLTMFKSQVQGGSQIDFKNTMSGQDSQELLGNAGNFAYYAVGTGYFNASILDEGAGLYAIKGAFTPSSPVTFSSLTLPHGQDASAKLQEGPGLASNGCGVKVP